MKSAEGELLTNAADRLRLEICEWFGTKSSEGVILAPGILVALRLLFQSLNVRKLLITSSEYYEPRHFPGIETQYCDPEDVPSISRQKNPDAVLMSVVSWRGRPLKVSDTFRRIVGTRNGSCPLLIADYAHAGAIGFPRIDGLNADITAGDLSKWALPPGVGDNIAFLHITNDKLRQQASDTFRPFYLGTTSSLDNSARWLPSSDVLAVQDWMTKQRMHRSDLLRQFKRNRKLATAIACSKGICVPSCIVWPARVTSVVAKLARRGLVWKRKDGVRVICRDLAPFTSPKKTSAKRARSNHNHKRVIRALRLAPSE